MSAPPTRTDSAPAEHDGDFSPPSEHTPLLPPSSNESRDQSQPQRERSALESLSSLHGSSKASKRRWPSILALLLLCLVVVLIIVFAFLAPSILEQYAQQAVTFDPASLSIDSFTASGVRARIQGDVVIDGRHVKSKPVRDIGRFCTWIAREAESGKSEVEVSLPEYGNLVLGTAHVPGIKVRLRDGSRTHVDILSDLEPGDADGIRALANDWLEGRLGQLRVLGKASVPLKSGIIGLGKQDVRHELTFANKDIPTIPAYEIHRLNFREVELPDGRGMAADVSLLVQNDYPVDFELPSLGFNILMDDCEKQEPSIKFADAVTHKVHVRPRAPLELNVTGLVHSLPSRLTQDCPGLKRSPLDLVLGRYIHGEENTIYVQGSTAPSETPPWISDLIRDLTVPVPLPGRSLGHLIKNFTLADTHFGLPDPFAEPSSPEANPRISAQVQALLALPDEMNFNISVGRVRAEADVFYKGDKLGNLDLRKWQPANSTRVEGGKGDGPTLMVQSQVKEAPLRITDEDVFADVIQELIFRNRGVTMHIKADVDVEVETALGEMVVRKIPAEGEVKIKPISHRPDGPGHGDLPSTLKPAISDLTLLSTDSSRLTLSALVNISNPTPYSADIPYIDVQLTKNGSVFGHVTARGLAIVPGRNTNLLVTGVYDPVVLGGDAAAAVGRELLSQYISGYNTTVRLQLHRGSLPTQPALGEALSRFGIDVPLPHVGTPGPTPPPPDDDDPADPADPGPHFLTDATMHLLTSTAAFTLLSPLRHDTLYLTRVNATAVYTDAAGAASDVGRIAYAAAPIAVPPRDPRTGAGARTPRLPVAWNPGSVGADAVRAALGGRLVLGARATVGVRLGRWEEELWFVGRGIGAAVRL